MPKATITKKDGTTKTYEPTYIDPEIQETMSVHFNPYAIFSQNLRAHELGVLIYMLSQAAIAPQEILRLSDVLSHFGTDDDVDLLQAIVKILESGLITTQLKDGETLDDILSMLKRTINPSD